LADNRKVMDISKIQEVVNTSPVKLSGIAATAAPWLATLETFYMILGVVYLLFLIVPMTFKFYKDVVKPWWKTF